MKNNKDNYLLPLCRQDTKKEKDSKKVQAPHGLLVVLRLFVIVGGLLIVIVVIVVGSMSETNAKSSQLNRSQRGIGVGDGWEETGTSGNSRGSHLTDYG
jgi:CHASE3 domain sensor protein